jgi:hypothetical protein
LDSKHGITLNIVVTQLPQKFAISALNLDIELPENYIGSDMKSSILGSVISAIKMQNIKGLKFF